MPEQQQLSGPHLQVAAFCEKVLVERDAVISLIRIFDRLNIITSGPDNPPSSAVSFTLLITFKSGFFRGKAFVKVTPITPNKEELPSFLFPVLFEGDDERGVYVQANITMQIKDEGLYWFDIALFDSSVTRAPLRIVFQHSPAIQSGM